MKLSKIWLLLLVLPAGICLGGTERGITPRDNGQPPNILILLADDLGWGDLSCYGNDRVPTPHIDQIAAEGVKLTQFYAAAPVCSPTRASILTGRFPLRFDIQMAFSDRGEFLPAIDDLPTRLADAGYATRHVGKWHLGGVRQKDTGMRDQVPGPHEHGFQHFMTQVEQQPLRREMIEARTIYREGGTHLLRDDQIVPPDDTYFKMYLTDLNADDAMLGIREAQQDGRPFFINLWWTTPHRPYEPAPEPQWSDTAADGISDDQHRFRSMVARMDFQIGRILALLDELGLAENTLVIFSSDNGGAWEANNGALKGGKADLHEGGIRVPFLARWPGHIPAGRTSDTLAVSTDFFPTLCAAAGISSATTTPPDGLNLLPLLQGQTDVLTRGPIFWRLISPQAVQRHPAEPLPQTNEAVRLGRWKLLALEGVPVELFDLESDLQETTNLLAAQPAVAAHLLAALETWKAEPRHPFGIVDPDPQVSPAGAARND